MRDIDFNLAIDLFKNQNYEEIIKNGLGRISKERSSIKSSRDLLKLVDVYLRTCLLKQDLISFYQGLDLVGNVDSIYHYHAAKYFKEGDEDRAWYYLSNCVPFDKSLHFFPSLGLNSIVKEKNWNSRFFLVI